MNLDAYSFGLYSVEVTHTIDILSCAKNCVMETFKMYISSQHLNLFVKDITVYTNVIFSHIRKLCVFKGCYNFIWK